MHSGLSWLGMCGDLPPLSLYVFMAWGLGMGTTFSNPHKILKYQSGRIVEPNRKLLCMACKPLNV